MYLKLYYNTRVKQEYQRRYSEALAEYTALSKEDKTRQNISKPAAVKVRNKVGKEIWEAEPADVNESVVTAARERHEVQLEQWKKSQLPPSTPQEFHELVLFDMC